MKHARKSIRSALLAGIALGFGASPHAAAETPPTQSTSNPFLKLSSDQRYWWIHGAVTTTAHVIAEQDKAKGDCAAKWFLSDRANKQRLIEETIAKHPSEGPTTIVISLLTQACGPLVTAK